MLLSNITSKKDKSNLYNGKQLSKNYKEEMNKTNLFDYLLEFFNA